MCGIAGIVNLKDGKPPGPEKLKSMANMLGHRGPDGTGYYSDNHVGLAHTRLSIIDLQTGEQPIHNEDKTIWVIFNGEIFNYIELREDLEKKGHQFYTRTDTEVLVHLYEEYGIDFVSQLNGQFAIALWDIKKKRLILVRDRVGITPLYYSKCSGHLYFASEVKAIAQVQDNALRLDPVGLDQLMTFWSPVSPGTVIEGIEEISPGCMIVVENGTIKKKRYWDWEFPVDGEYRTGSVKELADELHDLLVDAVQIRLRSDVPVGAYLSGGLDSSALVSLLHHHGGSKLRTFSLQFDDKDLDESSYQAKLVSHLGADHSSVLCANNDIADQFERGIWHTEQPILRTAPVPMMILSGLVRESGYKVVLTGEGADEVLGGYDIFKEEKIRQFWARNPDSTFRPLLLKRLYPYLNLSKSQTLVYLKNFFGDGIDKPNLSYFSHLPRWNTTSRIKAFYADNFSHKITSSALATIEESLPIAMAKWHSFNRSQYIEAKSLMAGYILCSQGDRMLMANSVEGRFPYLDHRVIEFSNSLHPNLKMHVLNEKYLLKKAIEKYLPVSIVKRYKQPYRAPDIPAFFSGKGNEKVDYLLSAGVLKQYGYFSADKVSRLIQKIRKGRAIGYKDNMAFVGILSTQMWHYLFTEKMVSTKITNNIKNNTGDKYVYRKSGERLYSR